MFFITSIWLEMRQREKKIPSGIEAQFSKCVGWTSRMTWDLVRNAESQAESQTH